MMANHTPVPPTAIDAEVKVGQVWADNDPRGYGRKLRVVEVDQTHATVADQSGRRTRIRLDRFRPTSNGYRLVTGTEGEQR